MVGPSPNITCITPLRLSVDHRPEHNVLPTAFRAFCYSIRGGGRMNAAKPEKILEKHGKTVAWNAAFVEELKSGLIACRAL